jgi:hypothetical protein
MSAMYCSRECHDKDTEQIESDLAFLRSTSGEINNSAVDRLGVAGSINNLNNTTTDNDASGFKYVEAGGFRLLVPIKKEN